ncbi:MAG: ABC transporter permease [Pseudomonadota bacterium]
MFSTYLVARRDYLGYVMAWGFWLGLLFTPVLIGIMMFAPVLAQNAQPTRYFTVIEAGTAFTQAMQDELDDSAARRARAMVDPIALAQGEDSDKLKAFDAAREAGATAEEALEAAGGAQVAIPTGDYVYVDPPARTIGELKPFLSGEATFETADGPQPLFAAFVLDPQSDEIQYWSENLQARDLTIMARRAEGKLSEEQVFSAAGVSATLISEARKARRDIVSQRLNPVADTGSNEVTTADRAPFIVSIFMAFMLWFLVFSVINYLLMGTIEERSNKIFDSLLTSVKLPNLLAGKLLAVLALSATLMTFWGVGSGLIFIFGSSALPADVAADFGTVAAAALNPIIIIPAVLSFVLGYLMYGSLFLALGSLCDTIQEAQTLMTPLIVLLMAPLFMITFAINDAESAVVQIMAWVPVFTPFLLILQMPTEPPLWQVLSQVALMTATTALILYLATRVYRAGAVHGAGVNDVWAFFGKLIPGRQAAS